MRWAQDIKPSLPGFISGKIPQNGRKPPTGQEDDVDFAMCLVEKMTAADFKLVTYSRFYMALMANEILKEKPMSEICMDFNCQRGQVQ